MEVQITDFENAAFAVFIVLLSRAILNFDLNLYMPISKVHLAYFRRSESEHSLIIRLTTTWQELNGETLQDRRSFTSARISSP
jgi:hypothetical protein